MTNRAILVALLMVPAFLSCGDDDGPVQPSQQPPRLQAPMLPSVFLTPSSPNPAASGAKALADSLLCLANSELADGRPFFDLLPDNWERDTGECWQQACSGATCLGSYTACHSSGRWTWSYGTDRSCVDVPGAHWTAYEARADDSNHAGILRVFEPFGDRVVSEWAWNQSTPPGAWQWTFLRYPGGHGQLSSVFASVDHDGDVPYRFIWRHGSAQWEATLNECHALTQFTAGLVGSPPTWTDRIRWASDGSGTWVKCDSTGTVVDSVSWGNHVAARG
jgi:hypothetical protein